MLVEEILINYVKCSVCPYAAYGGVYVSFALFWMWLIKGQRPDQWDVIGVVIILIGNGIIVFSPHK
ncbi:hypothetical protein [Bacteriovorax stolpii]